MSQIFNAFRYLRDAAAAARKQPLLPWVAIPLLFNIILFGTLYWLAGSWLAGWISSLATGFEFAGLLSFLNPAIEGAIWLVSLLLWVLLLAIFASVFTVAVQLVAAPFMGLLAEHTDRSVSDTPLPEETIGAMVVRTFRRELVKTWDWLWRTALVGLVLLILWLIPVVNVAVSLIWFLWSGWLLGIQYVDYGADTRQVPFRTLKRRARNKPWLVLTFGCLVLALTMVPLVNLVVMPVAVVAGTTIWHRELAPAEEPAAD